MSTDDLDLNWGGIGVAEEVVDVVDEDWLSGVSCNTDNPEECEACQ